MAQDAGKPYLIWPLFRRSVVAAFLRSLTVEGRQDLCPCVARVHGERGVGDLQRRLQVIDTLRQQSK